MGEWSTLVNPGRRIPQGIQSLTGITDDMVAAAPDFGAISEALAQRLGGKVLVAHNARFDYGFLRSEFRRAGVDYSAPVLCTVKLSRRLSPQHRRHNLDALIMRHALFCLDRHRGLGDARVLWELARIWRDEHGLEALDATCADLLRQPQVPPGLPPDAFDELPESPGAYVFHGEDGAVLYVGRSANIRARVLSHFSGRAHGGRDVHITGEVKRVEWIETTGELGASLKEAGLVKRLAPRYNATRSTGEEACSWRWRVETHSAPPEIVTGADIGFDDARDLYGVFRSRASAVQALREIARAHGLCRRLLGIERGRSEGPCSAHAHEHCRGACVGAESPLGHAMRLVQALSRLRLRPWPYEGRIMIRERDHATERCELHVLDRWRYLGTVRSEAELYELDAMTEPGPFDLDTYRILARFLKAPPRTCDIVPLRRRARELF